MVASGDWLRLGLENTAWAVRGAWVIVRAGRGVGEQPACAQLQPLSIWTHQLAVCT
jgi:hypothetical protein